MVRKMGENKRLIGELTQGRELAAQLNQLDPVESREACQALVEKIVSTYDNALSILNLTGFKREATDHLVQAFHQTPSVHTNRPLNQSLQKHVSKKRKTVPKWDEQMSVSTCSGDGGEDGHRWRKYGQKEILGAKFPRAYYRCKHRKTHGCLATKKIQKSDSDSSVFQISYKGRHTCARDSISSAASIDIPNTKSVVSKLNTSRATPLEALRNLQQGLKVETENVSGKEEIFSFSSDSFTPFSQLATENVESEVFVNILKNDSPLFLSPTTTSGSDFLQYDWQGNDYVYGLNSGGLQSFESDATINDMNLTPTSAFESPFMGLDFCVDQLNFDATTFLNDSLGYFS